MLMNPRIFIHFNNFLQILYVFRYLLLLLNISLFIIFIEKLITSVIE